MEWIETFLTGTVTEAVRMMREKSVSSLVVDEKRSPLGTVTLRDLEPRITD